MYEYKFVKVELTGIFNRSPKEDYHRLVEDYATEGWRLVHIFSPAVAVTVGGVPDYFEIIFERIAS
jgi:hypothetical protein